MKFPNYKGSCGRGQTISTGLVAAAIVMFISGDICADPLPGGTLDPTTIPKYVTPLVIPPVMKNNGSAGHYDISAREFKQQILPTGLPPTTVMSYGPAGDPTPAVAPSVNSQFNYPAYTVENTVNTPTVVSWTNDLVADPDACKISATPMIDPACNFVTTLAPVDRALHWANPEQLTCTNPGKTKDCRPSLVNGKILSVPYDGPVPITTHVHGAHVNPDSDGYPEAWWLPNANNIPVGYAMTGTLVNQYGTITNKDPGVATFTYRNDQPSTTLWYHDHTLGITRNNVYAGLAGFWLIRAAGGGEDGLVSGDVLPSPAPKAGETLADNKGQYREIPILIQDRSFNADGSLFYPANRAFFEGLGDGQTPGAKGNSMAGLNIQTIGTVTTKGKKEIPNPSDIATIWNPEAFFNTMVVNGSTWPKLDVAQAEYRFRLLNGCNSRFLNLAMFVVNADGSLGAEVPFYQIGADQSLMPNVIKVVTGSRTVLPNGTPQAAADPMTALLMGPAERADVLVDFSGLAPGTMVRVVNTAPDAPYGGFPDVPADPSTTGQIMQFVVDANLNGSSPTDPTGDTPATKPENLALSLPDPTDPANSDIPMAKVEDQAVLEEESILICAQMAPNGRITQDLLSIPDPLNPGTCVDANTGVLAASLPFAPKAAVLGKNGSAGGVATLWADPIATNPALGDSETWELWNWTEDAHPLHIHLVKFKILNREPFDPVTNALSGQKNPPELTENGWKDTVIAYPGEVTRVNATFDIAGLYVWHCHILEHEDNEMMVPFCVGSKGANGCNAVP